MPNQYRALRTLRYAMSYAVTTQDARSGKTFCYKRGLFERPRRRPCMRVAVVAMETSQYRDTVGRTRLERVAPNSPLPATT